MRLLNLRPRTGSEKQPLPVEDLFPAFKRFATDTGLAANAKGVLAAKVPRILGQGSTRAIGLDVPPAPIERKLEFVSLRGVELSLPIEVSNEMEAIQSEINSFKSELRREESIRLLASRALGALEGPTGRKDGQFFAGRLVLTSEASGLEWSWGVTPHYRLISRIPPDADYIAMAHGVAVRLIEKLVLSAEGFEDRLRLAWVLARHFASSDDVPVVDVMKMFTVASQSAKFWENPRRQAFVDLPTAAFVVNVLRWRENSKSTASPFQFVPATLNQAHGRKAQVFYLPMNDEGTEVRPMMYLRKQS